MRHVTLVVTAALLMAACSTTPDVIEFGDAQTPPPAPSSFDVFAYTNADTPAVDAVLAEGGVDAAAAFIRREIANGRPTLVNIFASWCGPCRAEMPLLNDTFLAYQDQIAFLGVAHLDRFEDALGFVDEFAVPFATVFDFDGDFAFAVESRGMPTTVVFDQDGQLVARVVGELTETSLMKLLNAVDVGV